MGNKRVESLRSRSRYAVEPEFQEKKLAHVMADVKVKPSLTQEQRRKRWAVYRRKNKAACAERRNRAMAALYDRNREEIGRENARKRFEQTYPPEMIDMLMTLYEYRSFTRRNGLLKRRLEFDGLGTA